MARSAEIRVHVSSCVLGQFGHILPIRNQKMRMSAKTDQRGGVMRPMTLCATILSLTITAAVASAQTPSPSAATPVASPTSKQAISKACSDQANAKGLHGKARKKFRSDCKKRGVAPQ
jgi:hypothetical protein